MSSSDSRMFEELVARVDALEIRVKALDDVRVKALVEARATDISGELYGAEADHTADRAERAALMKRPPRPA